MPYGDNYSPCKCNTIRPVWNKPRPLPIFLRCGWLVRDKTKPNRIAFAWRIIVPVRHSCAIVLLRRWSATTLSHYIPMPILYLFSIYRRLSDYYRPRNVLPDFLFQGKIRAVFRNSKGRCHGLYRENGISLCPDRRGKDCSCPPILSKHIELVGRRFERFRKCCVPEEGPRVDCFMCYKTDYDNIFKRNITPLFGFHGHGGLGFVDDVSGVDRAVQTAAERC